MVDFALVVPPVHDNPVEHRRMLAMRANNSFPKTGSESMQAPLRLKVFEEGNEPDPFLWEGSVIYTDAGNVKFSDGSTWLDIPSEPISLDQLQDIGANTVLCRPSGSSGPILQQPMGTNSVLARGNGTIISLSAPVSTVLRRLANGVFGFGQLETGHLDDAIVTLAKLAADVYQSAVVELGGDFTAGEEVRIVKVNGLGLINITGIGTNLAHSSSDTPASAAGAIPANFRPPANADNSYRQIATTFCDARVSSDGTFLIRYRDSTGAGVARTDSGTPPIITYNIT